VSFEHGKASARQARTRQTQLIFKRTPGPRHPHRIPPPDPNERPGSGGNDRQCSISHPSPKGIFFYKNHYEMIRDRER
jgi:hypothetical protein